jgi:hypothetical protein
VRKVETKCEHKLEKSVELLENLKRELLSEIALLSERVDDVERRVWWLERVTLDVNTTAVSLKK